MKTYADETGKCPYFLRHETIHDMDEIQNIVEHQELTMTNTRFSISFVFDELRKIEAKRSRVYSNPNKKAKYGDLLIGLLPHGKWSEAKKKKMIKNFMKSIIGEERLIYFAWEQRAGIATYIYIYIIDREWLPYRAITYQRNYYQNDAGQMCGKNDEGARLVRRKGDVKEYLGTGFGLTKSRIFCFKDPTDFIKRFIDVWLQMLKSMEMILQGKYVFPRKKLHFEMFRYLKRVYIHQNHLMAYMEMILNQLYVPIFPDAYDRVKKGYHKSDPIENQDSGILDDIFHHYSARFKNNKFHVEKELFKLNGRADEADANIDYMKKIFIEEIKSKFPDKAMRIGI